VAHSLQFAYLKPKDSTSRVLSFSDLYSFMKTYAIDDATDTQLRYLTRRYKWTTQYRNIIQSQLPLLTSERQQLIGLLIADGIRTFLY
jgi:hypothetical protein